MKKYGADSVAASIQVPGTGYVQKGALMRLASLYGWSVIHACTMNGDYLASPCRVWRQQLPMVPWRPQGACDEELRSCVRKIVATDPGVLRSEYTGLFVSGFPSVPCPPYESF